MTNPPQPPLERAEHNPVPHMKTTIQNLTCYFFHRPWRQRIASSYSRVFFRCNYCERHFAHSRAKYLISRIAERADWETTWKSEKRQWVRWFLWRTLKRTFRALESRLGTY